MQEVFLGPKVSPLLLCDWNANANANANVSVQSRLCFDLCCIWTTAAPHVRLGCRCRPTRVRLSASMFSNCIMSFPWQASPHELASRSRLITVSPLEAKAAVDLLPSKCHTSSRCRASPPTTLHRHSSECFSFWLIIPCFLSLSPQ